MLQIDSVSKLYKGGDKALDNISFSVEQGEFISVIGKSGAGKTTLFRLLIFDRDLILEGLKNIYKRKVF